MRQRGRQWGRQRGGPLGGRKERLLMNMPGDPSGSSGSVAIQDLQGGHISSYDQTTSLAIEGISGFGSITAIDKSFMSPTVDYDHGCIDFQSNTQPLLPTWATPPWIFKSPWAKPPPSRPSTPTWLLHIISFYPHRLRTKAKAEHSRRRYT